MKGDVLDRRNRLASRNLNVSPVETIPQDASYQADLDTSLPYLSVAPADSEPRLQVSTGQRYGLEVPPSQAIIMPPLDPSPMP